MSGTLKVIRRVTIEEGNSNTLDYGDVANSMRDTLVAGTPIQRPKTITIAAGASVKVWDFVADGAFAFLMVESEGYLWMSEKVDAPVSDSDPTAAGTAVNYPKRSISCVAPFYTDTILRPVVTSAATYAGSAFGSAASGRVYEIWLKNPGTDPVDATIAWTL